jgi:DNA polymerase-1
VIVTKSTLAGVINKLLVPGERGLDTETTGLFEDDRLFSLIIGDADENYYFNFQSYVGVDESFVLDRTSTLSSLRGIFEDERNTWFIHNAKFDMRMLAKENLSIRGNVHCTYAVERILKNNHIGDAYTLAKCAERRGWQKDEAVAEYVKKNKLITLVSMPGKKKKFELQHYDRVPFELIAPYGEKDGYLHRSLGLAQLSEFDALNADPRYPSMRELLANEIRLTKTCFRMERRGIKIDKPFVAKALEYEIDQVNRAEKEYLAFTGEAFVDSNPGLARVFDRLGEKYPLTAKGNPSFAGDVLEEMTTPVAALINKIRHHDKRGGTYYSSFLHFADKNDTIHPDARQAGTETGRFSYRDPNLQNVPKEDDPDDQATPYHVRESFIPHPDEFFYAVDYQQMEYRMMLDYAGETRLIAEVLAGADIHQAIADQVGITRKQAKTLNFAILYGAGINKIAGMLGVSKKEAYELKATYFGGLPRVQQFVRNVIRAGESRGFIFNWYGRRCNIARSDWAYILPNHLIQGGCADVVKVAMNRIDARLIEKKSPSSLQLQVHDELLIGCRYGDERIIEQIVDIMESVYKPQNGMKLTTSVEHFTTRWGHRNKIKGTPYGNAA